MSVILKTISQCPSYQLRSNTMRREPTMLEMVYGRNNETVSVGLSIFLHCVFRFWSMRPWLRRWHYVSDGPRTSWEQEEIVLLAVLTHVDNCMEYGIVIGGVDASNSIILSVVPVKVIPSVGSRMDDKNNNWNNLWICNVFCVYGVLLFAWAYSCCESIACGTIQWPNYTFVFLFVAVIFFWRISNMNSM